MTCEGLLSNPSGHSLSPTPAEEPSRAAVEEGQRIRRAASADATGCCVTITRVEEKLVIW